MPTNPSSQPKRPRLPEPRYVRIDGQAWHAGKLEGIFTTVTAKVGLALTATAAFAAVNTGFDTALVLGGFAAVTWMSITGIHKLLDAGFILPMAPRGSNLMQHTIDRWGKTVPPENEAHLLAQTARVRTWSRIATGGFGAVSVTAYAPYVLRHIVPDFSTSPLLALSAFAIAAIPPAILLTHYTGLMRRCDKLLQNNPPYRYCAKPPLKQPEKITEALPAKAVLG